MTIEYIESRNTTMIGSRALGVHTEKSDTDYVILLKDLPILLLPELINVGRYFQSIPPEGRNIRIIRRLVTDCGRKVDLIVVDHMVDYQTIVNAAKDLLEVPRYMLESKYYRVAMWNTALQHHGFTTNSLF